MNRADVTQPTIGAETREIPLSRGLVAIVDAADYEWLMQWKWFAAEVGGKGSGRFYAARQTPHPTNKGRQTMVYMHRLIANPPKGMHTDHANHNTLDNRRENLRVCTHAENARNQKRHGKKSRYKGVTKIGDFWHACIGRSEHLGGYESERDAALAYDRAAEKSYGEFAYLNLPGVTEEPQGRRDRSSSKKAVQKMRSPANSSKAGYRGVFSAGNGRAWGVKCGSQYLGCFPSAEDAARAYDAKAREVYGASAYLNFPEPQP